MHDILISRLCSRNGHQETSEPGVQPMAPREPGKAICNSLILIQKEIDKVNPSNKQELLSAVQALWSFNGCNKMRS